MRLIEMIIAPIALFAVALAAVVVLVANDIDWKYRFGNLLTGKLSDVAGLYLLPLLLVTVAQTIGWARRNDQHAIHLAALVTAAGFAAVKLLPPVAGAYEHAIGAVRWLLFLGTRDFAPIIVVLDPTDLIGLPAVAGAIWTWRRHFSERAAEVSTSSIESHQPHDNVTQVRLE